MTSADDFRLFDLESIARGCIEETQKFLQQLFSDSRYCFELFRRAYAELSNDALSHIYTIYLPALAQRARRHPSYFQSCQDDGYFARIALGSFYRACRGSQFPEKFTALPSVLKYLYACLHSAIVQDARDSAALTELEDDRELAASQPQTSHSRELWTHIQTLLPEPKYQQLAYLRFVLTMMPAEIVDALPQQWQSEREVTVALQLIRRRLRRDPVLRERAGLAEESE